MVSCNYLEAHHFWTLNPDREGSRLENGMSGSRRMGSVTSGVRHFHAPRKRTGLFRKEAVAAAMPGGAPISCRLGNRSLPGSEPGQVVVRIHGRQPFRERQRDKRARPLC